MSDNILDLQWFRWVEECPVNHIDFFEWRDHDVTSRFLIESRPVLNQALQKDYS